MLLGYMREEFCRTNGRAPTTPRRIDIEVRGRQQDSRWSCEPYWQLSRDHCSWGIMRRNRFMQRVVCAASFALGTALALPQPARADEGGASFWLPGLFGSLAAAPQQPGWSVATMYYHTSVDAGGDVAFARQVTRGNITTNFRGNL